MTRPAVPIRFLGALLLALAAAGCLPKIGDPCSSSLDCSQRGERLCDTTQQGGYCTIFNCEPDSCPDAAACVAFNHDIDPACSSTNDGSWPRFERTFCMAPCNDKTDCRANYDCVEVASLGGLVIDQKIPREKVCLVAVASQVDDGTVSGPPGVCGPGQPGTLPDPYEPAVGTGGAGGSGGAGGTGGSGGAGGTGGSGGAGGTGGTGGTGGAGGSGGGM